MRRRCRTTPRASWLETKNFINHSTTMTIGPAEGVGLLVIGQQPGAPPIDLYVALR